MSLSKAKLIKKLYNEGIFTLEDITLKSGKKSPYYCDFRLLISKPELYQELVDFMIKYLETLNLEYDHLGCVPIGSLPFSTSIANKLGRSFVIPRGETKSYGKKCSLEGKMNVGDNVLVIEDVITTGKSVLEAVDIIKNNGGIVKNIVSIFDREEEGEPIIKGQNIELHSLFSLNDLIVVLESEQLTDNLHLEKLKFHQEKNKKVQIDLHIENTDDYKRNQRKIKLENDYNELVSSEFNKKLLNIIKTKKTGVCLALDTKSWSNGKRHLEKCAPYICMVKLHLDLLVDWNKTATEELLALANTHNFLIMEDSKLDDVPEIVQRKVFQGNHQFGTWVDAVTMNVLNFSDNSKAITMYNYSRHSQSMTKNIVPIPLGQYSVPNSLVDKKFSHIVKESLLDNTDAKTKTRTIIQQNLYKTDNQFLRLTPGVIESEEDYIFEDDKLRYRTIENAIFRDRNHVVIIGSNILTSENVEEKCKSCAEKSWEYLNMNFKKILNLVE